MKISKINRTIFKVGDKEFFNEESAKKYIKEKPLKDLNIKKEKCEKRINHFAGHAFFNDGCNGDTEILLGYNQDLDEILKLSEALKTFVDISNEITVLKNTNNF